MLLYYEGEIMDKITICKEDGFVIVNGEGFKLDLRTIPDTVRVIQWDGSAGEIETAGVNDDNIPLTDISQYNHIIEAWVSAKAESMKPRVKTKEEKEIEDLIAIEYDFDSDLKVPMSIIVPEGTWIFKNSRESLTDILNDIKLAELLEEETVILHDQNHNPCEMSIESAILAAKAIGYKYRTERAKYKYKRSVLKEDKDK